MGKRSKRDEKNGEMKSRGSPSSLGVLRKGLTSPFILVCLDLKERVKSMEKRSSRYIAKKFHEEVLHRLMDQSTMMLKDVPDGDRLHNRRIVELMDDSN